MVAGKRFNSSSTHTLDERGRIVMPRKYRDALKGELALCYWIGGCITLLPPETQVEWEETILKSVPLNTREGQDFERIFRANYFDGIEMDKQGRVPIPQPLREKAGLDREVKLVGMGNRLEIWDLKRWEAKEKVAMEHYEENLYSLPLGGRGE